MLRRIASNGSPLGPTQAEVSLKPPRRHSTGTGSLPPLDRDYFLHTIRQSRNLRTLRIEKLCGKDCVLLQPLIALFKARYPRNLSRLHLSSPECYHSTDAADTYRSLAGSMGSPQLTHLTLDDDTYGPTLNESCIRTILNNSPNLTSLKIKITNKIPALHIPFDACPQLRQVALIGCRGITADSLRTLKNCCHLEFLRISTLWQRKGVRELLLGPHGLPLRVLDLRESPSAITSPYELSRTLSCLPLLRELYLCSDIDDDSLLLLGKSCPQLAAVSFAAPHLTDSGLQSHAPLLCGIQKLSISNGYALTDQALIALARHCPNLRALKCSGWKSITLNGLLALAKNCPRLKLLEVTRCGDFSSDDIRNFLQSCPQLKRIHLDPSNPIPKEFPQIRYGQFNEFDQIRIDPDLLQVPPDESFFREPIIPRNLIDSFLLEAVRHRDLTVVNKTLEMGANPNYCSERHPEETPALLAAQSGLFAILVSLRKAGAILKPISARLGSLNTRNHAPVLKFLLKARLSPNQVASNGLTPLQNMISQPPKGQNVCDPQCLRLLLKHGANPRILTRDGDTLVHLAARMGDITTLKILIDELGLEFERPNSNGSTPLDTALNPLQLEQFDTSQAAYFLIGRGADSPRFGYHNPLVLDSQLLREALFAKKGLQGIQTQVKGRSASFENPLHYAIDRGKDKLLAFLLRKGVDPKQRFPSHLNGTPLHLAVRCLRESHNLSIPVMEQLLNACDVNAIDENGQTPLHLLVSSIQSLTPNLEKLFALFKFRRASAQVKDHNGKTPLQLLDSNPNDLPPATLHKYRQLYIRIFHQRTSPNGRARSLVKPRPVRRIEATLSYTV